MKRWLWMIVLAGLAQPAGAVVVKSQDGRVVVTVEVKTIAGVEGRLVYSLSYDGRAVLADSGLGFVLKNGTTRDRGFWIVKTEERANDSTWRPVCGERSSVRDAYHAMSVDVVDAGGRPLRVTVRAYDQGMGLCYSFPDRGPSCSRRPSRVRRTLSHSTSKTPCPTSASRRRVMPSPRGWRPTRRARRRSC